MNVKVANISRNRGGVIIARTAANTATTNRRKGEKMQKLTKSGWAALIDFMVAKMCIGNKDKTYERTLFPDTELFSLMHLMGIHDYYKGLMDRLKKQNPHGCYLTSYGRGAAVVLGSVSTNTTDDLQTMADDAYERLPAWLKG